jgi:hypothetical protein
VSECEWGQLYGYTQSSVKRRLISGTWVLQSRSTATLATRSRSIKVLTTGYIYKAISYKRSELIVPFAFYEYELIALCTLHYLLSNYPGTVDKELQPYRRRGTTLGEYPIEA